MGGPRTRRQSAEAEDAGSRIGSTRRFFQSSKVPKILSARADDPTTVVDTSSMSRLPDTIWGALFEFLDTMSVVYLSSASRWTRAAFRRRVKALALRHHYYSYCLRPKGGMERAELAMRLRKAALPSLLTWLSALTHVRINDFWGLEELVDSGVASRLKRLEICGLSDSWKVDSFFRKGRLRQLEHLCVSLWWPLDPDTAQFLRALCASNALPALKFLRVHCYDPVRASYEEILTDRLQAGALPQLKQLELHRVFVTDQLKQAVAARPGLRLMYRR